MFDAASVEVTGSLVVDAPVDEAFELFSPAGEEAWVTGWKPEWLYPPSAAWLPGQVFRTRNDVAEVIWIVAALDHTMHRVVYHRLEPVRHVARVQVQCAAQGADRTEVVVQYHFVGLSEMGNQEIGAMTPTGHAERMLKWRSSIEQHLQAERERRRRTRG